MEIVCISDIFKRSVGKYKVIYKNYIGDGDIKVYKRICEVEPNREDFKIEKKEDINYVGKRIGKRLLFPYQDDKGTICQEEDNKRVKKSIRKTVLASQEVRRSNRKRKLHGNDDSYVPGGH
ncbi:hypothetical protein TKK_0007195 [Trichogramma kaykai]